MRSLLVFTVMMRVGRDLGGEGGVYRYILGWFVIYVQENIHT